jgi:hypothetical protein
MLHVAGAQVMESTSYKIQSDSINFGGGLSTSDSYTLESTMGEVATGDMSGDTFNLRAGYQQMTGSFISITAADAVVMTPSIPGISGGFANGSTSVTVTTDSPAGYSLSIRAESAPALVKGADSIADYVPTGNPDFEFITDATDSHFGYSPSGEDVAQRFLDNGSACGVGSGEVSLKCWDGLSVIDEIIAQSTSGNSPGGTETTVHFRVGVGGSVVQTAGVYTATTTLTALSL